jgi:hypothetical protein
VPRTAEGDRGAQSSHPSADDDHAQTRDDLVPGLTPQPAQHRKTIELAAKCR